MEKQDKIGQDFGKHLQALMNTFNVCQIKIIKTACTQSGTLNTKLVEMGTI